MEVSASHSADPARKPIPRGTPRAQGKQSAIAMVADMTTTAATVAGDGG